MTVKEPVGHASAESEAIRFGKSRLKAVVVGITHLLYERLSRNDCGTVAICVGPWYRKSLDTKVSGKKPPASYLKLRVERRGGDKLQLERA